MKRAARESQDITRSPRSGGSTFPETSRTEPTRGKKALDFVFLLYQNSIICVSGLCFLLFHNSLITFLFFLAYFFFRFVSVLSSKRTVPKLYLMSLRSIYNKYSQFTHNILFFLCFRMGLRIALDKNYPNSYVHGLYI